MKQKLAVAGYVLGGALAGALLLHVMSGAAAPDDDDRPAKEAAEPAEADGALHVDAAKTGLQLANLRGVTMSDAQQGYARAIDLAPLAAIGAEITSAQAALAASSAAAQRLGVLAAQDGNASRREAQAASAQAIADKARLTLACQRVGLEFGAGLARLGCGAIPGLAQAAAGGQRAVIRIDMPSGPPPTGAMVMVGEGGKAMGLRVLGPAISGDAQLQTSGVLALADGPALREMSVGRVLPARLEMSRSGQAGVMVPRAALIRADGGLFVYRAKGKDGFERVALVGAVPGDAGWQVPVGLLHAGDRIVVEGAGTLLGLEHAAPAAGGDD
jgi:hypothetical protein